MNNGKYPANDVDDGNSNKINIFWIISFPVVWMNVECNPLNTIWFEHAKGLLLTAIK